MAENTGKTAIVTGASRGIGLAIAKKLAKSGYNIAVVDACDLEKSEDAVKEVKALGVDAKAYQCNVADFAAVEQTVKQINEDFGGIYILVNNAGITRDGLLIKMSEENFDAVINVNLKGTFNFIKHVSPIMMKKREGRVVSISSIVGIEGQAGQVNYSASKAGVRGPGRPGQLLRFKGRRHRNHKVLRKGVRFKKHHLQRDRSRIC